MPNYYDYEAKMGRVSQSHYPNDVFDYRLKIKIYLSKKEDFGSYKIASIDDDGEVKIIIEFKPNEKPKGDRWIKVDALIKNELLLLKSSKAEFVNHTEMSSRQTKAAITFMKGSMPISKTKKFSLA